MAGFSSDDDDIIAGINVTPLVDITLVLLIIFMVTTSHIVRAQITVDLPKAASGEAKAQSTLVVQVMEDGTYQLNGETKTLVEVADWAKKAKAENPDARAIIAADKKVEYEKVVDAIDAIKVAGIEKFALNIERKFKVGAK